MVEEQWLQHPNKHANLLLYHQVSAIEMEKYLYVNFIASKISFRECFIVEVCIVKWLMDVSYYMKEVSNHLTFCPCTVEVYVFRVNEN